MSASAMMTALATLIALALVARGRAYHTTSTSLMFMSGALAAFYLLAYLAYAILILG